MAAHMVSSAVAQEAVSQALSKLKERYGHKSDGKEHMERMEMAHIKLEAALDTSNKWNVTSMPLLRWRSKLKRAAQECDNSLRRCKQHLEEEERQHLVTSSTFPKRIAHTARSFVSSFFSRGVGDELTGSTIRRFERFVDGASEFLRYVELGGTPHQYMFFDPMIRYLLSGKGTKYCSVHGGQHLSFFLHPFSPPEHGMEGMLIFFLEDGNVPENNFFLSLSLWLTESINIVGVAVRCLQLFTPHLSSTAKTVKTKLTQLPTHDFCWMQDMAYSVFGHKEYWDNLHTIRWKLFQPTPVCRQQQDCHYEQRYDACRKSSSSESLPCDMYLEPVTQVHLLGHVTLLAGDNDRQSAVANGETCPMRESPFLKLGGHLWPQASSEDMLPAVGGSATEMINRQVTPRGLYANISFDQLGEIMVPKAEDCLGRNVAASLYQMLWKSKHGSAYLQAEKTSWPHIPSGLKLKGRGAKKQKQSRPKMVMHQWISEINEFMSSWILHAPAHVQASFVNWVENGKPLLLPLSLRTTSCVHDCPIKSLFLPDWHTSSARKIRSSSTFIALRTDGTQYERSGQCDLRGCSS